MANEAAQGELPESTVLSAGSKTSHSENADLNDRVASDPPQSSPA